MLHRLKQHFQQFTHCSAEERARKAYLRSLKLSTRQLNRAKDYRQLEFLALDLEMTSLDASSGEIVSIGYVPIIEGEIDISQGFSSLVSNTQTVGDSATIHHICDRHAAQGIEPEDMFPPLFEAMRGRVLLLHCANLDLAFLDRYCRDIYQVHFFCSVVDTMSLEIRRLARQQQVVGAGQLRLYQCRERYGLPRYRAHSAYTDALATAELFLAQTAAMAGKNSLSLKQLL